MRCYLGLQRNDRGARQVNRSGTSRLLVAWMALLFVGLVQVGEARSGGTGGSTTLLVFDCYATVPGEFVVNTREYGYTRLFLTSGSAKIIVKPFRGPLGEPLEKTGSFHSHGLTVEEFRPTGVNRLDPLFRAIRIHDGKQEMMVYGATDHLVDTALSTCASNKLPTVIGE